MGYALLNGRGSNGYLWATDAHVGSLVGDFEIICLIQSEVDPSVSPQVDGTDLVTQWHSGNLGFQFAVWTDGRLRLRIASSASGSTIYGSMQSNVLSWTANQHYWLRVTFDLDNGSGQCLATFYRSTDPIDTDPTSVSWTNVGSDSSLASPPALFNSTGNWNLGSAENNTGGFTDRQLDGNFYLARVWSDLTRTTLIADPDFRDTDQAFWGIRFGDDGQANTWTLEGTSIWVGDTPSLSRPPVVTENPGNQSNNPVTLPTNLVVGRKLYIVLAHDGSGVTVTNWDGMTEIAAFTITSGGDWKVRVAERVIDGTEGTTVDVVLSAGERSTAIAFSVLNGDDPEISAGVYSTSGANPDSITPSGGLMAYLFVAVASSGDETTTITAAPANYSHFAEGDTGTAGGATSHADIALGMRIAEVSSEDPGAFSTTGDDFHAFTIAIPSVASGVALLKIEGETAEVDETDLGILGIIQIATETVQIAEQDLKLRALVRLNDEVVEVSESVLRQLDLIRLQAEVIEIAEQSIHAGQLLRTHGESVEISEQEDNLLGLYRQEDEDSEIAETDNRLKGLLRSETEDVDIVETDLRFMFLIRVEDEDENTPENDLRLLGLLRVEDEEVELAEEDLTNLGLLRLIDEDIEIGETDFSVRGLFRIENDEVQIDETDLGFLGILKIQDDPVQISEQILRHLDLVRVVNENLNLAEEDLHYLALLRVEDEVIQVSELDLPLRDLIRIAVENSNISETEIAIVASTGNAILKIENESVFLSETDLQYRDLARLVNESLSLDEQLLKYQSLVRVESEVERVLETLIAARDMIRQEDESTQITEAISYIRGLPARIVNEISEMAESVVNVIALELTGVLRKWRDFQARDRDHSPEDRDYNPEDRDYD